MTQIKPEFSHLPDPLKEKADWLWSKVPGFLKQFTPDCNLFPKISIVTPSYNQAQYLEETIRSVLLQNYPNLEYIIIDGGSTDGSVEIIKKYEPWLTYWESKKDRGQPHAINKGFELSTGEIMAWINSDDFYFPGAFYDIVNLVRENPDSRWYAGTCYYLYQDGSKEQQSLIPINHSNIELWLIHSRLMQPSVFWHRSLWEQAGPLDESLQFSFDYDLWLNFVEYQPFPTFTERALSYFRFHSASKTMLNQEKFTIENKKIWKRHSNLVVSIPKKLKVWKLRKEHLARRLLRQSAGHWDMMKILFSNAPWLFVNYIMRFIRNRIDKFLSHIIL